ncbi:MAG: hypothetical protein GY938_18585 [Ketobacter sp.]|nr:hypothetical protein [Ketobacter sp.]
MKNFSKQAAQGDILIQRIDKLPDGAVKQKPQNNNYIIAHSETGHHHTISSSHVDFFHSANDPMVMFLVVNKPSTLIHNRSFDTHRPLRIDKGVFEIRRQREYTPEGWRRVAD